MRPADAWIDPSQPKPRAWVTHGHGDHARGGHGAVLATPETLAIMERPLRAAERASRSPMTRPSASATSTCASSPPATSSARRRSCMEHKGERVVVSGDYKRRPDPTCACFVPVPCDIFVTEATFGLPVFRHPDTGQRDRPAAPSAALRPGAAACWSAPMRWARRSGSSPSCARAAITTPIYFHGAIERLYQLYESFGVELGELRHADRRDQGGDGGSHRHRPAGRAQRPLVAAAARSGDGDGVRLDAHPPARPPAQRRAAADHLRSRRLGRAHHDHPRARADAKSGSPTAARKRSSTGA